MTTSVDAACYVFGIVSAGAPVPDTDGSGPASRLRLVKTEDLAALVGSLPRDRPLGRARDLLAHDAVLAQLVSAGTPVLPMRFGAVLTDDDAVAEELLRPHYEEFCAALARVAGRVQYTLKVRYHQATVLPEIVARNPKIARLRDRAGGQAASFDRQIELGRLVVSALEDMRPETADGVLADLRDHGDVRVRDVAGPEQVLDAAFLVEHRKAGRFEEVVEAVGQRHAGRLRIRLVGPSPPYDFVGTE
jgi:hypothetical protein